MKFYNTHLEVMQHYGLVLDINNDIDYTLLIVNQNSFSKGHFYYRDLD